MDYVGGRRPFLRMTSSGESALKSSIHHAGHDLALFRIHHDVPAGLPAAENDALVEWRARIPHDTVRIVGRSHGGEDTVEFE